MLATRSLLCLLVVAVLNVAASDSEGACSNITPQQGVTLNSIVGHWYLYRAVGPRKIDTSTSECIDVNIQLVNETTININVPISNMTFVLHLNDPQKPWILTSSTGAVMMAAYMSADGNRMVQTFCRPNRLAKGYMLYSKDTPISQEELTNIQRHLDEAGVIRTSDTEAFTTWQSTATCAAPA